VGQAPLIAYLLLPFLLFSYHASPAPAPSVTAATLDRYLTNLVPLGFSGNVIVARQGTVVLEKGYGLADREKNVPVTSDTVMTVGSISKQFTAAAILKLEMQGKLHTTDSISRYLPNVPADKSAITIHELLTHTAGLAHDYGPSDYEPIGRDAYVARVMAAPLASTPGARFDYSNAGYNLLAAIVELVSGESYERFLHDNLFAPAGMMNTGFHIPHWSASQIAVGYNDGTRRGTMPEHWLPDGPYWNQEGSGGIQSTPRDMYRWHIALSGNSILSEAERTRFQTGYVASGPDEQYAYGWGIRQTPVGLLVSHNGGNGTFFADFLRFIDRDTVIYIASNESAIPATLISRKVAYLAFDMPVTAPPAVASMSASVLQNRSGTYKTPDGRQLSITTDDGRLIVRTADSRLFALLSEKPPQDVANDVTAKTQAFIKNRGPVDAGDHPNWRRLVETNGAFRSATMLGALSDGEDPATWIVVRFERATKYVELLWNPDGLDGVAATDNGPGFVYYPESSDRFFSYDVVSGMVRHLSFNQRGDLQIGTESLVRLNTP